MQEYFKGLRRIKTRSDNVHAYKWPCTFIVFIGLLSSLVYPPIGIIASIGIYLWFFLQYRLSLSSCPRCHHKFYSVVNILLSGSIYTKSGMWAVSCNHCSLKLSELPEVKEIKIASHTDEWLD